VKAVKKEALEKSIGGVQTAHDICEQKLREPWEAFDDL